MTDIIHKRETVAGILGVSVEAWTDQQVDEEYFKLMECEDNL